MKKYYQIKRNLISFFKRTISFSFVGARTFDRARTINQTFDRARTFTRTFDRGVVRRQNSDLKFCSRIFYYAAGKTGMCMIFLLVQRKTDDELPVTGEEKIKDFFMLLFL